MAYETVTILDASGNPIDIVVDTLASGAKIQVVRADLGVDTATAPVNNTIPVSASALPLPTGAATSALQTTGNTSLATIAGAISGGVMQTSAAGATQYTEAATDSTITGNAIMWEDTSDTLRAVSAVKPLPTAMISAAADPFGLNADAASGTGSISAKLRYLATVPKVASTGFGGADLGVPAFALRDDVLTTISEAELEYTWLRTDSQGRLWTSAVIKDSLGGSVSFDPMRRIEATPTLGTGLCEQFDSLHTTIITLSQVVLTDGGTGHILGATLTSRHNTFNGKIKAYFFDASVTGTTAQAALSISDTDQEKSIGTLEFDFSRSNGAVSRVANADRIDLPIPFKCSAGIDDIFCILQLWSADAPTFGASDLKLRVMFQPDS